MTFRIFSVLLCLLTGLPAAVLAAPLSAQDEARLIYLEKRLSELEGRDRELRAYADKAAKGEADGVKDIAAAQVQGAKEGLSGQLAGLSSNFNMLLGFGGVVATLLIAIFFGGAWFAKREARSVAEAEMKTMEGELKAKEGELNTMVAELKQSLKAEEQEVLDALRKETGLLIEAIKEAERQARESAQAAGESRDKAKEALSDMVKDPSRPKLTPEERQESERLKAETKGRPLSGLTKAQLTELTKQALADEQPAEAAKYAEALADKDENAPYPLILLARSKLKLNLRADALRAALCAVQVARTQGDKWAEGVAHSDVGDALQADDRVLEAYEAYLRSRDIFSEMAQKKPMVLAWQTQLAAVWGRIGSLRQDVKDNKAAKEAYIECRNIIERLLCDYQDRTDLQQELAVVWCRLGDVSFEDHSWEDAKAAFEKYRSLTENLVKQDPSRIDWKRNLALALGRLGDMALENKNGEEASEKYRGALNISQEISKIYPENVDCQRDVETSLRRCAKSAIFCECTDVAGVYLHEAQEIVENLHATDPTRSIYRQDHAWLKGVWGDYYAATGKADEAKRFWGEAVTELTCLEDSRRLNFLGGRALKEYRAKLEAA